MKNNALLFFIGIILIFSVGSFEGSAQSRVVVTGKMK